MMDSANEAMLYKMQGMSLSESGELYIADEYNYVIRRIRFTEIAFTSIESE